MLQNIRQISILNKIFNVKQNEWRKISISWFLNFLYRFGFVVGWTILVAIFSSKYGIASLPYLFLMVAAFTIIGSLFYSVFLSRFEDVSIMIFSLFSAVFSLFLAFYFSDTNQVLFFAFLIVSISIFLNQFKIILTNFVEEMFDPLQSERTFPLIESAETIGGIIAGIIVTVLSKNIEISSFILIWIVALLLIVPLIYFYENLDSVLSLAHKKQKEGKPFELLNKIREEFLGSKYWPYVRGMVLIVFFQWILFNLLEFQYTKAVYINVSHVVLDAGGGFEHAFVHDLGELFILFSSLALLVQLFIGSRIINYLGVFGSMILHPIITLFSLMGITISFNYQAAVLAKSNFTMTSVIYLNTYHSSYYALNERIRNYVREFLEGVVRPAGAIFGMLVLVGLQRYLLESQQIFFVNLSMLLVALGFFVVTYLQQENYTKIALDSLKNSTNKHERIEALDILAQRGHKKYSLSVFKKILFNKNESVSMKVRVIRAFSETKDLSFGKLLIKCLDSRTPAIKSASLDTLLSYNFYNNKKHLFVSVELIDKLEKLFESEKSNEIRGKIINLLSRISSKKSLVFIKRVLDGDKENLKADAIYALGNCNDPSVVGLIRPYLKSADSRQRRYALASLGKFGGSRRDVLDIVDGCFDSKNSEEIADALYLVGELCLKNKKNECKKHLYSDNMKLKIQSSVALAKMGYSDSIPVLVNLLMYHDKHTSKEVKYLLKNVDVRISENLDRIIKHLVDSEIKKIITKEKEKSLQNYAKENLLTLRWFYRLAEEYEEVDNIDSIITN